ncbi:MAG: hypothetical protein ACRELV_16055 [Longimicrobiales bacterium]
MCARSRAVRLLCFFPLLTACYAYTPVQSVEPGMAVRARLTAAAAVRESESRNEVVREVEGLVVRADADSLALDILLVRGQSGGRTIEFRDTLNLMRLEVETLQAREFSAWRTAAAVAGVGLLGAVMIDQLSAGGEGEDDGDGGTRQARIPLSDVLGFVLSYMR